MATDDRGELHPDVAAVLELLVAVRLRRIREAAATDADPPHDESDEAPS